MDFFNDDPFESIVREFFGESPSRISRGNFIRGEGEERTIDFIRTKDKVFLVFELPGYSKEDIEIHVSKNEIEVNAQKKNLSNIQGYLSQKLNKGIYFKRVLPKDVNTKKFDFTFRNGILEVVFSRK